MQKTYWGGVMVLGILLAGFVFAAGCDGDPCDGGLCTKWSTYSGPPTNNQVIPGRTLVLHPDQSFTLTYKTYVQQGNFGNSVPGQDAIVVGTWERPDENTVIIKNQAQASDVIVLHFEPGIPRLSTYGYQQIYYRNQDDWIRWTDHTGRPMQLPA